MVRDVEFLRRNTDRPIKITVPGPFTMTQQAQNDYYPDAAAAAMAFAAAVNEELRDLKRAGADVVQIDEPYLQARPDEAEKYALAAIDARARRHRRHHRAAHVFRLRARRARATRRVSVLGGTRRHARRRKS